MEGIDALDKKILYHLDLNSRISYSELGKRLRKSKEVVNYRIKRLMQEKYITQFYTIINMHKLGFYAMKIYINLQDMTKDKYQEIIKYLKEHKMVFWIATANGVYELFVGVWVKDLYDYNKNFLVPFQNRFSQHISEKDTTITLHNYQINRKWFHKGKERKTTDTGGRIEIEKLDEIDQGILKLIANNARIQYFDIAKKLKTTFQVVKYRIEQMQKKGIIIHYKLGVDPKVYGREFVKTIVNLKNVNEKRLKELMHYALSLEPTLNAVHCLGLWDVEFEMEIENLEEYHKVMNQIREEFSDIVKSYRTAVMIDEPKVTFMPDID